MAPYLQCPLKPPKGFPEKVYPLNCEVQIVVGICSEAYLCPYKFCPFYDKSEDADEVFYDTLHYENTLEGVKNPRVKEIDLMIYNLFLETTDIDSLNKYFGNY